MNIPVVLGLAAVALALAFVVLPFTRGAAPRRVPGARPDPRLHLEDLRDKLLASIVALDFDRDVGKLDEDEYQRERADLKRQAVAVLHLLDDVGEGPAPAPDSWETPAERAATAPMDGYGATCAACGALRAVTARFCPACGAPQTPASAVPEVSVSDSIERDVLALRRQRAARPAVVRVSGSRRGKSR